MPQYLSVASGFRRKISAGMRTSDSRSLPLPSLR